MDSIGLDLQPEFLHDENTICQYISIYVQYIEIKHDNSMNLSIYSKKNKQPIFYQYKIFVILGCPLKTPKAPLLTIVREHAEGARPRTVRGGFPSIIYLARNRLISMFKSATKTIYIYTARLFLLATIDQLVLWKLLGKKKLYTPSVFFVLNIWFSKRNTNNYFSE